jgi:uncharacterized protein (DUF58 family)
LLVLAPSPTARARSVDELLGPELMGRLDRLDVLSRKVFAGKLPGERRSKRRGASVEFDDYRVYVPGDDLRRIDWNVFARMDRFFLKLFREEEDLALHLIIDASASMDAGSPSKLALAQKVAMAIGYIGLVNSSRVIATVIGAPGRPNFQQLAPIRGRRNLERLGRFLLENVYGDERQPGRAASLNLGLRAAATSRRGKGVTLLLSDFLVREDLKTGLNYLASAGAGGFDVYCLQALAPGELDPEKEAGGGLLGDLRLTDAETGAPSEVTISGSLLKRYKQRVQGHIDAVHAACAARGMTHLMVRSDADVGQLLLGYLRRRGMLG